MWDSRNIQRGRLPVQIAEEIIERLVDLHVHIDGDMNRLNLDGLGFNADATGQSGGREEQKKAEALPVHRVETVISFRRVRKMKDSSIVAYFRHPSALGNRCRSG